jgi:hypothetical protein
VPEDVATANVGRQRLIWSVGGLFGATLVLIGGIGAVRSWDSTS